MLFNVVGPYNAILNAISSTIGNTYIVRYRSNNPSCDGQLRQVKIIVNAFGQQAEAVGQYVPCAAPQIQRTQATINLSNNAIVSGTQVIIEAVITDVAEPFVQDAFVFYKTTGKPSYNRITMTRVGNNLYRAIIPGSQVNAPGIDYYITATDGQVTSSDP